MTIKIGDRLPAVNFKTITGAGEAALSTDDVFKGRRVVLFAVTGAFTSTCSNSHLPQFIRGLDAIKAKGVDAVACTSVNDPAVMHAWFKQAGVDERILMLADGNGDFAIACGLDIDKRAGGMGLRSQRYSMIVDDGVVKALNVETKPGVNVSGTETLMGQL